MARPDEPPHLPADHRQLSVRGPVRKVWCATPDSCGEMFREIAFRQEGSTIHITLPWLKYWSMVVIEY
ncbi:glycoside hydrolase family 66 protein [uncultured Alistipes sp.]|uniref:glycoside hydrolase family 66 protein n=1 Tax=Alistipes sp. An66 TaxID=1965650 RepID=UPI003457F71A